LFAAYMSAMGVYTEIGAVDTAIQYGFRAFALPATINDYAIRFDIGANTGALGDLALLLSGDGVHYRHTLDSLIAVLRPYVAAPIPAAKAKVPSYPEYVARTRQLYEAGLEELRRIGNPAPALIATHWFNQPRPATVSSEAPQARELKQDDGIIRVLGFGFFACPYCQMAMGEWEKFQHELPPGVQCLFYDRGVGSWGPDLVEPDVEAEHYRHYYVERKHYTYPIAIWAGPKEKNEEGGITPKYSPTMGKYGIWGGPWIMVVDGHGILRYKHGGWDKQGVLHITRALVREQQQQRSVQGAQAPSPTPPPPNAPAPSPTVPVRPTASLIVTDPSAVALAQTPPASPARLHSDR
jgi:hypothetical protein